MFGPAINRWDAADPASPCDRLTRAVDAWIRSPGFLELVHGEHLDVPEGLSTGELLDRMLVATTPWDIRRGRERNDVSPPEPWEPTRARRVLDAATALGLRDPPPPSTQPWDTILVLGGRLGACLSRVAYADELARPIGSQQTRVKVVGVTARRPLDAREREVAAVLGLGVDDEYELMCRLLADTTQARQSFGQTVSTSHDGGAVFRATPDHTVIAAPSTNPGRRANTYDTLAWWARHHPPVGDGHARLLVVTSSIYTTYQGLVAVRALGLRHRWSVETVGVPAAVATRYPDTATLRPDHYLQEIRATLQEARTALDEVASAEA